MPAAYVKKAAREAGVALRTAERRWAECEKAARAKRPRPKNLYAYVTACFKRRMGLENPARLPGDISRQREILPGGRADYVPDSAFNPRALREGTQHEMEHTRNRRVAREIAKDHLLEDPQYYRKLKRMERKNPGEPAPSAVSRYEEFHGVEPAEFQAGKLWVPGDLTLIGEAVEVNYQIIDPDSDKELNQVYFHDHGPRVKVYKRCERGERADLSYSTFPKDLVVLGSFPGLTLHTDDGHTEEIPGSQKKLVAAPDRRRLVIVDARGVLYLIKGGKLKVEDWIYN
jgi:hypothetical protein